MNDSSARPIKCSGVRQMIWYVILGFFSAFGVLCAFWTVFGLLLPGSVSCDLTLRCVPGRELAVLRRLCWLREMGLLRLRLTVTDSKLNRQQKNMITEKYPYIRFM